MGTHTLSLSHTHTHLQAKGRSLRDLCEKQPVNDSDGSARLLSHNRRARALGPDPSLVLAPKSVSRLTGRCLNPKPSLFLAPQSVSPPSQGGASLLPSANFVALAKFGSRGRLSDQRPVASEAADGLVRPEAPLALSDQRPAAEPLLPRPVASEAADGLRKQRPVARSVSPPFSATREAPPCSASREVPPCSASFPARTRSSPVSPGSQGRVRWQFYSFSSYRILATRHAPGPKAESVCSLGSTLSGGGGAVVRVSPARVSPYSPTRLPHPSESVRVGPCLELTGRSKPCQRRLRPLHTRARVRADSATAATERPSDTR